jgi:hypothetical protein
MSTPPLINIFDSSNRYAHDQQIAEGFRIQYGLPPSAAGEVAKRARIYDFTLRPPVTDLLLGTAKKITWAVFAVHESVFQITLSSYVALGLGSEQMVQGYMSKIKSIRETLGAKEILTPEERQFSVEGETLYHLLDYGVNQPNQLVSYVISRMNQFLPA